MSQTSRFASALLTQPPCQRWEAIATGAVIVCARVSFPYGIEAARLTEEKVPKPNPIYKALAKFAQATKPAEPTSCNRHDGEPHLGESAVSTISPLHRATYDTSFRDLPSATALGPDLSVSPHPTALLTCNSPRLRAPAAATHLSAAFSMSSSASSSALMAHAAEPAVDLEPPPPAPIDPESPPPTKRRGRRREAAAAPEAPTHPEPPTPPPPPPPAGVPPTAPAPTTPTRKLRGRPRKDAAATPTPPTPPPPPATPDPPSSSPTPASPDPPTVPAVQPRKPLGRPRKTAAKAPPAGAPPALFGGAPQPFQPPLDDPHSNLGQLDVGTEVTVLNQRDGSCHGTYMVAGGLRTAYEWHLGEVTAAPARAPGLPPPSLEAFGRQMALEAQCRNMALEAYRQDLLQMVDERSTDRAAPVRRLLDKWVPQLTAVLEERIKQFLSFEGTTTPLPIGKKFKPRAGVDSPDRRQRVANMMPLARAVGAADREATQQQGGGGALGAAGGGSSTAAVAAAATAAAVANTWRAGTAGGGEAEDAVPRMMELAKWVPFVLPVPPQMLAKGILAAVMNSVVLHDNDHEGEMPTGMAYSVNVADTMGRAVTDMVSYMAACERVDEKRRELRAATREHRAARAPDGGEGGQEVKEGEVVKEGGKEAAGELETSAAEGEASSVYDFRVSQAAARVREARRALHELELTCIALQPGGLEADLRGGPTSAAARRQAVGGGGGGGAGGGGEGGRKLPPRTRTRMIELIGMADKVQLWDQKLRVQVGASLLDLVLSTCTVNCPEGSEGERGEAPAFRHSTAAAMTFHHRGFQTPGMVISHPQLLRMMESDEELLRLLQPRYMPMLVEPRPWSGPTRGGFVTQSVPVLKARYSPVILEDLRRAHKAGAMQQLYDALTVLGNVPWRIHRRVLEVMEVVTLSGGGQAGLPASEEERLPQRFTSRMNEHYQALLGNEVPEEYGTPYMRLQRDGHRGGQLLVGGGAMCRGEEAEYQRLCDDVRVANRNVSGQRSVLLNRLQVARQYAGGEGPSGRGGLLGALPGDKHLACLLPPLPLRPPGSNEAVVFYQPHNVDFRGRAYPLHPHLNHLGDDAARGLLQFGVGRPLGQRGFQWLLMQIANLWGKGVDKLPLPERLAWAKAHLPAVRAAAASPLEGGSGAWWQRAEKPWQMLATCFELAEALEAPSTAAFVSYQPVNQDGTCNGLQHYAALGRDRRGAAAVNLLPADRPQDVYTAVANAVAERVERDRAAGRSEAAKAYGSVDRKLVKQTVMTYVYGVTMIGARDQIENRLEERGWTNARERRKVATYLARTTFQSMGDVFGPAMAVRAWLEDCAKFATTAEQPVMWLSPLGYPIQQPYRKLPMTAVYTKLQNFYLLDHSGEASAPIDARRQRSGFAPNYIHSLDGAHMMMTARDVRQAGGCFAAVHDSFWTHAVDVDQMNTIIRDTFITLHSRPLLQELRQQLLTNPLYDTALTALPPVPPPGDLDLQDIRESTYFFS